MQYPVHADVGFIARSPDRCWRSFTDPSVLPAWVPGLRRARTVSSFPDGYAREVLFEFRASLTYSLVYEYEHETRTVRWEPRVGGRDAVRGFAQIEPWDGGSRMTYGIAAVERTRPDLDPRALISAFASWIETVRPAYVSLSA